MIYNLFAPDQEWFCNKQNIRILIEKSTKQSPNKTFLFYSGVFSVITVEVSKLKSLFLLQTELETDKDLSFYLIHIRKLDMLN